MKKLLLAAAAFLFLSGCRKEILPVDQTVLNSSVEKINAVQELQKTIVLRINAIPDPAFGTAQCLPAEYGITISGGSMLSGTVTMLGDLNSGASFCRVKICNMKAGLAGFTTQNYGQFADAEGTLIYFNTTQLTNLISGALTGQVNIMGGTGKFSAASGTIEIRGRVNLKTGAAIWNGTGTISFAGGSTPI